MNDIIKLSVEKIYQSNEVIEKEVAGYKILSDLLDVFITAVNNSFENKASNYDKLVIRLLPENYRQTKETLYDRIFSICSFISSMSDGYALLLNKKIKGEIL